MMTIEWNVIVGVPAFVLGVLIMWGFRRYPFVWSGTATEHFGAAIFWMVARSNGRSVWWDLFDGFNLGNSSNWIWNLIGIYAGYHMLLGLLALLDPEERQRYNILTVVFYPNRLWRRMNDSDHG